MSFLIRFWLLVGCGYDILGRMTYIQASILAIVQGITEFLPVSSSGHLLFVHQLFGQLESTLGFDVALHWGTVLATVAVFRRDLWSLLKNWLKSMRAWDGSAEQRLPWYMIIFSLPAAVVGAVFGTQIEAIFRTADWVILLLVAVAFLFFAVEKASTQARALEHMTWKDALMIGWAQVLALMPGVSRSGITIVAGMSRNFKREDAARFSFIGAVPLIFVAGLKDLLDLAQAGTVTATEGLTMALGILISGVVGFFALRFLLQFVKKFSLRWFAWYRIGLAIVALLLIRFS